MPSASLLQWNTVRKPALEEIRSAHISVGGSGRGRRCATPQINRAYVMLLSGQFQGYCRDLHSECLDYLLQEITSLPLRTVLSSMSLSGRKLDTGNPSPGNIGADFGGFGFRFWDAVYTQDKRNKTRRSHLEALNEWRNAIAHQDFSSSKLGGRSEVQFNGDKAVARRLQQLSDLFRHGHAKADCRYNRLLSLVRQKWYKQLRNLRQELASQEWDSVFGSR